jgi:pyrroloquinoline-quinone synthase
LHDRRDTLGVVSERGFVESVRAAIGARRSFGSHPLWTAILEGSLPRERLRGFAAQFFLQVREFPRAVSALHSRCSDPQQRIELAESLYEEETGRISGCNLPHPELFVQFGLGLGLERSELVEASPLPATAALIHWFELSTRERSFLEGLAAIQLASEGQVPGNFGPFARALEKHYGLTPEDVAFWDVHEQADREHSDVGRSIVVRLASTPETQEIALAALERSLTMWWHFFDGIHRAP